MKTLFKIFILSLVASSAIAGQVIQCREINKNGSYKVKGIQINLNLKDQKSGEGSIVSTKNARPQKLTVKTSNQGTSIYGSDYTTLFLAHEADVDEMLDIQLQFKSKILKKNFVNLSAEYVVGSESANPEYSYGYSYKMSCNGQVQ